MSGVVYARGCTGSTYYTQAGVVGLREDGVRGIEDELGEEDLVCAFIDLMRVSAAAR